MGEWMGFTTRIGLFLSDANTSQQRLQNGRRIDKSTY